MKIRFMSSIAIPKVGNGTGVASFLAPAPNFVSLGQIAARFNFKFYFSLIFLIVCAHDKIAGYFFVFLSSRQMVSRKYLFSYLLCVLVRVLVNLCSRLHMF